MTTNGQYPEPTHRPHRPGRRSRGAARRRAVPGQEGHRRPGPPGRAGHGLPARRRPLPDRGLPRPGQDADGVDDGAGRGWRLRPAAVHAGPGARRPRRDPHLAAVAGGLRRSSGARCSRTSCWRTRSTAPPRRSSRRCSRRWPSGTCRSPARRAPLPRPFLVLATQNPIESEGVYALPEAQRDRFLMHVVVQQPTYEEEIAIAHRMCGRPPQAEQVLTQRAARRAAGRRPRRVRPPRRAGLRRPPRHGDPRARPLGPGRPVPADRARRQPARDAGPARPRPGRSPCSAAGGTSCRRTCTTWRPRCCGTASRSPTTRSPRACTPRPSWSRCSARVPAPQHLAAAGRGAHQQRGDGPAWRRDERATARRCRRPTPPPGRRCCAASSWPSRAGSTGRRQR